MCPSRPACRDIDQIVNRPARPARPARTTPVRAGWTNDNVDPWINALMAPLVWSDIDEDEMPHLTDSSSSSDESDDSHSEVFHPQASHLGAQRFHLDAPPVVINGHHRLRAMHNILD